MTTAKNLLPEILFVADFSNRNYLTFFDTKVVFVRLWKEIIYLTILYEKCYGSIHALLLNETTFSKNQTSYAST